MSPNRNKTVTSVTSERLVEALMALWNSHSHAEISVRMVCAEAETSVSAIAYHFGTLEQLYCESQKRRLAQASLWFEQTLNRLSPIKAGDLPPEALALLISSLIDEWTEGQRPLALAWKEAHHAALTRPGAMSAPHLEWTKMWRRFWKELLGNGGMMPRELVACYFDGEASQHLIRWNRALDLALLGETSASLFRHLSGELPQPSAIRQFHQSSAKSTYVLEEGALTEFSPLDHSAAEILATQGIAALTFRGVAAHARTTLGAVSYHFGSKASMLHRAFQCLYEASAGQSFEELEQLLPATTEELIETTVQNVTQGVPLLRAHDELVLHLCRDSGQGPLGGVIRSHQDPIGQAVMNRLTRDPERVTPALVASFASTIRGLSHQALGMDQFEAVQFARKALAPLHRPTPSVEAKP